MGRKEHKRRELKRAAKTSAQRIEGFFSKRKKQGEIITACHC